jgi:hypothetical protein
MRSSRATRGSSGRLLGRLPRCAGGVGGSGGRYRPWDLLAFGQVGSARMVHSGETNSGRNGVRPSIAATHSVDRGPSSWPRTRRCHRCRFGTRPPRIATVAVGPAVPEATIGPCAEPVGLRGGSCSPPPTPGGHARPRPAAVTARPNKISGWRYRDGGPTGHGLLGAHRRPGRTVSGPGAPWRASRAPAPAGSTTRVACPPPAAPADA